MHFISYLSYNNPKITPSDIYFFLPILTFRGAIFDFIGEILNNKYGPKLTILFGNTIFNINNNFGKIKSRGRFAKKSFKKTIKWK